MTDTKSKTITVRVTKELNEHVEIESSKRDLSKSDYIRELIELDSDMKHDSEE